MLDGSWGVVGFFVFVFLAKVFCFFMTFTELILEDVTKLLLVLNRKLELLIFFFETLKKFSRTFLLRREKIRIRISIIYIFLFYLILLKILQYTLFIPLLVSTCSFSIFDLSIYFYFILFYRYLS